MISKAQPWFHQSSDSGGAPTWKSSAPAASRTDNHARPGQQVVGVLDHLGEVAHQEDVGPS